MAKSDKPVNVVAMPSFTDPNRPHMAGGTINRNVEDSAIEHDESYGLGRSARNTSDDPAFAPVEDADRSDWTKAQWKAQCEEYGLPVSGNLDELQARVEEYEAGASDDGEEN